MSKLDRAIREIVTLRRLLMEADHVLSFARNKGVCNERLKERIQSHLERKVLTSNPRRQILPR